MHDFTETAFREYIRMAKTRYRFIGFKEIETYMGNDREPALILRHDIDASPHRALALAKIEKQEGVKATFFVQLDSYFYNVFEKDVLTILRKISQLGFSLGLHISISKYEINLDEAAIEEMIRFEKQILERFLDVNLEAVSFHDPSKKLLSLATDYTYAGLVNSYAKKITEKFMYVSDSNGYWRYKKLSEMLNDPDATRLQVLLHPEWWQKRPMQPWEKIERCVEGRRENQKSTYINNLKNMGRKNLGLKRR